MDERTSDPDLQWKWFEEWAEEENLNVHTEAGALMWRAWQASLTVNNERSQSDGRDDEDCLD